MLVHRYQYTDELNKLSAEFSTKNPQGCKNTHEERQDLKDYSRGLEDLKFVRPEEGLQCSRYLIVPGKGNFNLLKYFHFTSKLVKGKDTLFVCVNSIA